MDNSIDDILSELKQKYGVSKVELERIIDSQFKVLRETMETKRPNVVNMIYLGKFKSTTFLDVLERRKKERDELVNKI